MLLGFDIGGTKCAVVLGTASAETITIVDKESFDTNLPVYQIIEKLFNTAENLMSRQQINLTELSGIGVSCGGPLSSKKGIILSPPNLPGWDNIHIVEMAEKRFGRKVLLQNDANACAVAEWKYGAGRGYDNLIFLTFGTGMGAGLILDGRLYSGIADLAGEVGHIRLNDMGPVGFGKAGSFEGFCSGGGIAQLGQTMARQKLQMGEPVAFCKSLADLQNITAKNVAEAAFAGDLTAIAVYDLCAEYLGRALSIFIDLLNPELIILGSIYGRATNLIAPKMNEIIESEAITASRVSCRIVQAGLSENIGDMAALSLAILSHN